MTARSHTLSPVHHIPQPLQFHQPTWGFSQHAHWNITAHSLHPFPACFLLLRDLEGAEREEQHRLLQTHIPQRSEHQEGTLGGNPPLLSK